MTARIKLCGLMLTVAISGMLPLPAARADQPPSNVRIGVLTLPGRSEAETALRDGLSDLGYVEGKSVTFEWKSADSNSAEEYQARASALVQSRVDVIVAIGTPAARAALSATSTIPVVFISGDPIGTGLAASLAHPGANATGVSSLTTDLMAKRLELLLQIAPRTRRVLLLLNPDNPLHSTLLEETQKVARTLRIHIVPLSARNPAELDAALGTIQRSAGEALVVTSEGVFITNRDKIADAARRTKLPTVVPTKDYWGDGVLMSYGPSVREMERRAAVYIDKILRGAKPADLPIEQGSKFDLRIDLHVARELGLKVPQDLLYRADEVIR